MAAGAVDGADDWKDDLSAVSMPCEYDLVAEFAGVGEAIGGMAEEDAEVCGSVAGVRGGIVHPRPFAAGDKQFETLDLGMDMASGGRLPAAVFECLADELVVVAPVMVTEDEPAGGNLGERFKDFDGGLQELWIVDEVSGEHDGIGWLLEGEIHDAAIEFESGGTGEMEVGEVEDAE